MTLPDRSQLSRITFVRGAGNPSLMSFAHPALTRAVRTPLESGSPPAGHDALDLLTLEGTPKDHPGARAELTACRFSSGRTWRDVAPSATVTQGRGVSQM